MTSTAIDNFTEDNQQYSLLLDQFHLDSEELELSSSDDTYSLSDDDCELFYGDNSSNDEMIDAQPSHHDVNVDKERSSSTLAKDSSDDPLYAFPTTSGTINATLTNQRHVLQFWLIHSNIALLKVLCKICWSS